MPRLPVRTRAGARDPLYVRLPAPRVADGKPPDDSRVRNGHVPCSPKRALDVRELRRARVRPLRQVRQVRTKPALASRLGMRLQTSQPLSTSSNAKLGVMRSCDGCNPQPRVSPRTTSHNRERLHDGLTPRHDVRPLLLGVSAFPHDVCGDLLDAAAGTHNGLLV